MYLIGFDCATLDTKIGLSLGKVSEGNLTIIEAFRCSNKSPAAKKLTEWLQSQNGPVLIAVDAPLGWPNLMRDALKSHRAGEAISVKPDSMFHRTTDDFVREKLGKTSLEVGADRIARAAHAALRILEEVRQVTQKPIHLAWVPKLDEGVSAIEVYPSATLMAHGFQSEGYKKPRNTAERKNIITSLKTQMTLPDDCSPLEKSADVLDAVVCVLAGWDFLRGLAHAPDNRELAEIEGWIWVRSKTK